MKKLLFILIFIPLISFGQENVLNIETIKDEYIKVIAGITYYNEKPYTGVFYRNYKNGQLRRKEAFKNGKKDGLVEEYSIKGQLEYKANFKSGKHNGISEQYNKKTGKLQFKNTWENHKMNGLSEQYYETGELEFKGNFKDNKLTGVVNWYHKNGQLSKKETYKAGKRDGLFEQYYETGQLEYKGNYKDNELTGVYNGYYKNGQLESKRTYKSDKKDGLVEEYYKNGQLKEKILYKNGEIILNYRSVIGDTNIEDVNVYDLEAMVRLFLKDCELNNIKLSSDYKITSTFETLDKGEVALAYGIFNDKEIIIKVSPEKWSKSSNPKKWYILYHELGHDVLNLQHGQGGKMMFNFTEKDYTWDDFFKDKDYMFNSMKSK